jgi:hypothetical protein
MPTLSSSGLVVMTSNAAAVIHILKLFVIAVAAGQAVFKQGMNSGGRRHCSPQREV